MACEETKRLDFEAEGEDYTYWETSLAIWVRIVEGYVEWTLEALVPQIAGTTSRILVKIDFHNILPLTKW